MAQGCPFAPAGTMANAVAAVRKRTDTVRISADRAERVKTERLVKAKNRLMTTKLTTTVGLDNHPGSNEP